MIGCWRHRRVEVVLGSFLTVDDDLKKSASVVAKDSARMVNVFTCLSSASAFSMVSFMVSLKIVSATEVVEAPRVFLSRSGSLDTSGDLQPPSPPPSSLLPSPPFRLGFT